MSVSVITPAYRAESTIARVVKSMLAQTHSDWEMIIVADDGQDYQAILGAEGISDPRLRFASTGRTGAGPGTARNTGADAAKHPVVAHLDADDAYSEDYLSVMVPLAKEHGACTSSVRMIREKPSEQMPLTTAPTKDTKLEVTHMLSGIATYVNIVIDRRRCPARWPEGIHYGEDLLLWLLLLDELPAIHYCAQTRYDYYYRLGSLSRPVNGTRILCEHRDRMLEWIARGKPPIRNAANRDFIKRWLRICNEVESMFNYTLVETDEYMKAMKPRLDALVRSFGSTAIDAA